jgi:hypothetical protein
MSLKCIDIRNLSSCGPVPYLKREFRNPSRLISDFSSPSPDSPGIVVSPQSTQNAVFSLVLPEHPTPGDTLVLPEHLALGDTLVLPAHPTLADTLVLPPRPMPSVTISDATIEFTTPSADSSVWPGFAQASNEPHPNSWMPGDLFNGPPVPSSEIPKLSTSHLTVPSNPTPLPDIPHIISSRSSLAPLLILPPRPTIETSETPSPSFAIPSADPMPTDASQRSSMPFPLLVLPPRPMRG